MSNPKEVLRQKLQAFATAAVELNEAWEKLPSRSDLTDALNDEYPFESNFEDLVEEILAWKEAVEKA